MWRLEDNVDDEQVTNNLSYCILHYLLMIELKKKKVKKKKMKKMLKVKNGYYIYTRELIYFISIWHK